MTDLGTLNDSLVTSKAFGINNEGHVVGSNYDSSCQEFHTFLYTDGPMMDLGVSGSAWDINDNGWIVGKTGSSTFLYISGATTELVGLDQPYAINASGETVGYSISGNKWLASLYDNGTVISLGSLMENSVANDINAGGQIVGECWTAGSESTAFLYDSGIMSLTTTRSPATVAV